jgi:hypothetical protein
VPAQVAIQLPADVCERYNPELQEVQRTAEEVQEAQCAPTVSQATQV